MVLLKNDGKLLPLNPDKLRSIAVIGALATDGLSALGSWRAQGKAEEVVTMLAGHHGRGAEDAEGAVRAGRGSAHAPTSRAFPRR